MDYAAEIDGCLDGNRLVVSDDWSTAPGRAFGGFLAATALRIAERESTQPSPVSLHGRYFRPTPVEKPIEVIHRVEHSGRSYDSHEIRLVLDERTLAVFMVQRATGRHAPYSNRFDTPPDQSLPTRPIADFLSEMGVDPPNHMKHTRFEGPEIDPDEVHTLVSRWSVRKGQASLAAILPIDNCVAPAVWRAHGELGGLPSAEPVSLDVTAWFHDTEIEDGMIHAETRVPVSANGLSVGTTEVWFGDKRVATGVSATSAAPFPAPNA